MIRKFLFYFAVTGWVLGLIAHLLSLADVDVEGAIPFVWILHFGIFVVWIPIIIELKNNEEYKAYRQLKTEGKAERLGFLKAIFHNAPGWMKIIAIAGFYYAILNFIIFFFTEHGTPVVKDGLFILQNHGQFLRTLTEKEYHHFKANELRGFSGHWIAFYGIAMAALFPQKNKLQGKMT